MTERRRVGRLAALLLGILPCTPAMAESSIGNWSFRMASSGQAAHDHPQATQWHPAHIPGSVQSDLIRAGLLPDPYWRDNESRVQWAGLADWTYRGTLHVDAADRAAPHLDLVFDGLDTFAIVRLNGRVVLDADNMFRTWTVPDIAPLLKPGDNTIEIGFRSPVPLMQAQLRDEAHLLPGEFDSSFGDEPKGRQTQGYVRKAGFHYGWDWGPRILGEGIWRPVRLMRRGAVTLRSLHVGTRALTPETASLSVGAETDLDAGGHYRATVRAISPDGTPITTTLDLALPSGHATIDIPLSIAHPALWWPVGYGGQPLYRVSMTLENLATHAADTATRRTGLRTVRLLRDRDRFGRGFGFAINGVPIFAKGANMIPLDLLDERVTPGKLDRLLEMTRAANMNMIRVWGGGLYGSDAFYDRADELGLMVWQDFAFGGAVTPPDAAFADNVRVEAEQQVRRLRDHPSLVLWCGNNEMQTGWESWPDRQDFARAISPQTRDGIVAGMTHLFGGILPEVVARLDPETPYWDTTPGSGFDGPANVPDDGDMHVWTVWSGSKPITDYLAVTPRFQSEYGLEALPALATLRETMVPADLDAETPVMRAHQKFAAGNGNQRLSLYIGQNYGTPRDFASFAYLSQVMQADGIALAAEHLRASRPRSMGSLYWQLNDVWQGPSWSAIDYDNRPKALWYRSRAFYAPLMVTVLPDAGGFAVSAVSDARMPTDATVRVSAVNVRGGSRVLFTRKLSLTPLAANDIGHLTASGLDTMHEVLVAELLVNGAPVSRRVLAPAGYWKLALPDPGLATHWSADGRSLTLSATHYAHAISLDTDGLDAQPEDDFFDLLPGETRTIAFTGDADPATLHRRLLVRSLFGATR